MSNVLLSYQSSLISKLHQLGLHGMAENYESQASNPNVYRNLSIDDRLADMVSAQEDYEHQRQCERIVKNARFRDRISLDEIATAPSDGLTPEILRELTGMAWVEQTNNLIITGSTGVGKTALACAIGYQLAEHGISVLYTRTANLLDEIGSKSDYEKRKRAMLRVDRFKVLILDDFAVAESFDEEKTRLLLDLTEKRWGLKPVIICSQYRLNGFYGLFPKGAAAESLMDRIMHPSIEIALSGESRRARQSRKLS